MRHMKSIPLLDNYEDVVRLIKSPGVVSDSFFEHSFENQLITNYILIPVAFKSKNGSFNYQILPAVHSFHPCANEYLDRDHQPTHFLQKHLGTIEKELKLTDERREYFWCSHRNDVQLLIMVHCQFTSDPENLQLIQYCHALLRGENEAIKEYIQARILKGNKSKVAESFIPKMHHQISIFLRKLSDRIKPATKEELFVLSENYDKLDCLKIVYMYGNQILTFLEYDYLNLIDRDYNASISYLLQKQVDRKNDTEFIIKYLQELYIDQNLISALLLPLSRLNCGLYGKSIAYVELDYCEHYTLQLFQLLQEKFCEPQAVLESFLISMNFNALQFFKYYCNKIKRDIDGANSYAYKLEVLFDTAKIIKQEVYHHKAKFERNLPPVKQQLLNWIEEETKFQKKKMTLAPIIPQLVAASDKGKINSGLSVAQIAYFCSLLMQSGIIQDDNVSELLRVVCENFKTSKSENISHESLRHKYYSVEYATVEAVHEKLLQLVKLTKI